jgi:hypothetical protein
MDFLRRLFASLWFTPAPPGGSDDAHHRCQALAEAALALAAADREAHGVEDVMRITVRAARALTGGAAALALVGRDGALRRFASEGADGCIRETLARPDVLAALVARLSDLGRPLGRGDLDTPLGRTLDAIAPRGLCAVPLGAESAGVLVLIDASGDAEIGAEAVAAAALLGVLAGAALRSAWRVGRLRESREELRRLTGRMLAERDQELRQTSHVLHEGICQRLAAANALSRPSIRCSRVRPRGPGSATRVRWSTRRSASCGSWRTT